ncbi:hypothetical protein [Stenotrophomonas sp.]|uniref:hypothetical protein n=1 Tax=Stenotrophomonas sp. TaxID=69392 RepID=UPI0028AB8335|nr:hypothetical protein [Stenotrophomonas sp.]
MKAFATLVQFEVVVCIAAALLLLHFQLSAYRRYRRPLFATLVTSTILGMIATALGSAACFVPLDEGAALTSFWVAIPVAVLATVLAARGSVQLCRAMDDFIGRPPSD